MSWVTIVWSISAAACLTLGTEHLLVWCRKSTAWSSLLFFLLAASIAAMGAIELSEMQAQTPEQLATLHRWYHVPIWVGILSVAGFVRVRLHAGRAWLFWALCGVRTVSLVLNFLIGQNLNYLEVTRLRHIRWLGESISVAEGIPNPWMLVGQLSALLFVVFVVDAEITVWRRGDRRTALTTGCGLVFFVVVGSTHAVLAHWQLIVSPLMTSIFYLPVVAATAYEMTREVVRSGELAEDLRKSETRFRAAFEQAAMGIAHVSPEGRFLRVNQRFCEITGFSQPEMLKRTFQGITYPADRAADTVLLDKLLSGERDTCSREKRCVRENGEFVWIHATTALIRDRAGSPDWFIVTIEDVSARTQAEERVRQLSHVLEHSPVLVVITDQYGDISYVNRKFSEVTGYSFLESIGRNPRFLKSGETSSAKYQELWASITSGETWRGEFRNRKKTGELYWESAVISPLRDAAGRTTHFVAIKQDITEAKLAELEDGQQREQIVHLSRVATLSELSSSLAHELNQPLAIILTNAQAAQRLLAQQPPDLAEARDILTDIVSEDQRAAEVIRRLRSLLKDGKTSLQPLDVNETVETVLQLMRSDLTRQSVTVQPSLANNLPCISGDHIQLQQVLLNLILNACDAMAGKPPENRHLILATARCNSAVRVSISDTGCGLPQDVSRVFEPFYTTKKQGLGLGLSICASIVQAHKGRLWGEACMAAGGGATFHLELPAVNGVTP